TSTTERQVAEILAWVLERAEIGPHDDFFALGGDSLRAIQAILWLNSELNRQVPINALFEARTVYGLAMLLDADDAPEAELVLAADLARPFDLSREQPIRIRLVRQHDESALLLLVVHAIAADDRSRELIAKQVRGAYRGLTVSAPALRYVDYAEWQREMAAAP